jgi:hypothetical protein
MIAGRATILDRRVRFGGAYGVPNSGRGCALHGYTRCERRHRGLARRLVTVRWRGPPCCPPAAMRAGPTAEALPDGVTISD